VLGAQNHKRKKKKKEGEFSAAVVCFFQLFYTSTATLGNMGHHAKPGKRGKGEKGRPNVYSKTTIDQILLLKGIPLRVLMPQLDKKEKGQKRKSRIADCAVFCSRPGAQVILIGARGRGRREKKEEGGRRGRAMGGGGGKLGVSEINPPISLNQHKKKKRGRRGPVAHPLRLSLEGAARSSPVRRGREEEGKKKKGEHKTAPSSISSL